MGHQADGYAQPSTLDEASTPSNQHHPTQQDHAGQQRMEQPRPTYGTLGHRQDRTEHHEAEVHGRAVEDEGHSDHGPYREPNEHWWRPTISERRVGRIRCNRRASLPPGT